MDDRFIRAGSPTNERMAANGISFIAFSPLAQGLLLGKYSKDNPPKFEPGDFRENAPKFQVEHLARIEPMIAALKNYFGASPEALCRAALQYVLKQRVVGAVIPGFRNLAQVKMNLAAADKPLSDDEFALMGRIFAEINVN
jgi:aryl-alcohol dehydrogenase-like predicted oxidoreductase